MSDADPAQALRLGVVGLGLAGGVMSSAVKTHPGFVLAGAAEPNPELRQRFVANEAIEAQADIAELVRRSDIDAVYIATPHQFHRTHAVMAAQAGKHIIVEKPMALSLDDCDAMIEAAEAAGVTLIVGHTHGYDPALRVMRQLMQDEVGEPALVTALNYTNFLYRPRKSEELDVARGGGVVFNQMPHMIDAVRRLVGRPALTVRASTFVLDPERPSEGACTALITFEGGAAASLSYSGHDGFDSDELYGWVGEGGHAKTPSHGAARRRLSEIEDEQAERSLGMGYGSGLSAQRPANQPHFGQLIATCADGDLRTSPGGVTLYTASGMREVAVQPDPWRPGWGDVLETLRAAVVHGEPPVQDGRFARDTVEICLAIQHSSREGRDVVLAGGR